MSRLGEAWFKLRYHEQQTRAWRDDVRFKQIYAGRGSGKTEIARRFVVRNLPIIKPWRDPIYFYALPTYSWAKRVAWNPLKNLVPKEWVHNISESSLTIETIFGSTLFLLGMDVPSRAEGVQWDGGILDECSDQKPGVFSRTFMPAFSHRNAWCWRIGVPKRYGAGAPEFKKACDLGLTDDPDYQTYHWKSGTVLTPEQLEVAKRTLSVTDYDEQYNASWEQAGGQVFYAFEEDSNVSRAVQYNKDKPIIIGSDFNVNPMSWVLCQEYKEELHVFDEIFLRNSNTPATLTHLAEQYADKHKGQWLFYGDASGKARKSATSNTDYLLIRKDERFNPKRVLYPRSNPAVKDRFAACNALLKNAKGDVRLKIHPRCTNLITDLKHRAYKKKSSEPNDSGDISHMSDALGYVIYPRYPLFVKTAGKKEVEIHA